MSGNLNTSAHHQLSTIVLTDSLDRLHIMFWQQIAMTVTGERAWHPN